MKSKHAIIIAFLVLLCVLVYTFASLDKAEAPTSDRSSDEQSLVGDNVVYKQIQSVVPDKEKGIVEVTYQNNRKISFSLGNDEWLRNSLEYTEIVDINYDGYDDVMLVASAGAYNVYTYFMVFNLANKNFSEYEIFVKQSSEDSAGLGFVDFDKEGKKLKSFFKGRGIGDIYTENTYIFQDSSWNQATSVVQDLIDFDNPEYYFKTTSTIKNGTSTSDTVEYFKKGPGDDYLNLIKIQKTELQKKGLIK
jgi:hypothetical protein